MCYSLGLNVKLSGNESWVNLCFLSCETRFSTLGSLFSILDSQFAQESRIANGVENRDSQRTVNLLLNGAVESIVLNWVRLIKFDVWVSHQTCVIWVDLHVNRYKVWYMKRLTLTEPLVFCSTETRSYGLSWPHRLAIHFHM